MRALVVRAFGGPEVMTVEEVAAPVPAAGQVLVRVKAIGVNPVDTYIRSGTYARKPELPYTPHTDIAGIVEAVGSGVTRVNAGDRVYAFMTNAGGAELALAEEWQVQRLAGRASFEQGAASGVPHTISSGCTQHVTAVRPTRSTIHHLVSLTSNLSSALAGRPSEGSATNLRYAADQRRGTVHP